MKIKIKEYIMKKSISENFYDKKKENLLGLAEKLFISSTKFYNFLKSLKKNKSFLILNPRVFA